MSLLVIIIHHDSFIVYIKNFFISACGCCHFSVTERYGDVHNSLSFVFLYSPTIVFFHFGILVNSFFNFRDPALLSRLVVLEFGLKSIFAGLKLGLGLNRKELDFEL